MYNHLASQAQRVEAVTAEEITEVAEGSKKSYSLPEQPTGYIKSKKHDFF